MSTEDDIAQLAFGDDVEPVEQLADYINRKLPRDAFAAGRLSVALDRRRSELSRLLWDRAHESSLSPESMLVSIVVLLAWAFPFWELSGVPQLLYLGVSVLVLLAWGAGQNRGKELRRRQLEAEVKSQLQQAARDGLSWPEVDVLVLEAELASFKPTWRERRVSLGRLIVRRASQGLLGIWWTALTVAIFGSLISTPVILLWPRMGPGALWPGIALGLLLTAFVLWMHHLRAKALTRAVDKKIARQSRASQ